MARPRAVTYRCRWSAWIELCVVGFDCSDMSAAAFKELNNADARVIDADGAAFLKRLRESSVEIAARWGESEVALEAFATLAEWTGEAQAAATTIEAGLPTLEPSLQPSAHFWLGRLMADNG